MLRGLWRTKSVDALIHESEVKGHRLKRVLGPLDVTMVGIGAIIGAGIFAMVGEAAVGASSGHPAGPALIVSFLLTAVACGFTALCYAELSAMVPVSGSAYTYSYATMGELVAWIIGWDLIIEYAIGNVAVAISWAGYFNDFVKTAFGLDIPVWLRIDYRTFVQKGLDLAGVPHLLGVPVIFNLPALCIVLALTVLLVVGVKESAAFNNVMVGVKLLVLALFVGVGFYYFHPEYWKPFAPGGWKGIQVGAATVFFAYIGFDAVSTVAEETKNPRRDMPIGIIGSLAICTLVYILVTVALTGMIPVMELRSKIAEPLVAGLEYNRASPWIIAVIALGSVIAHTAVLLVFQLGQPRIFFAMSRDGLLPPYFAKVHPRFKTPHVTTIWTGVVVGILSALCNIDEMANLCNIGTLFAFILVCAGVIILRFQDPLRPRPFRVPGGIIMPVLGIGFCLFLMGGLNYVTWLRFGVWLLLGLAIYFLYGAKRSALRARTQADRIPAHGAGDELV
ncbi:MAG TPA: amino acid permease [Elusimicrobia bacterium]|nr:amino acid permease [Elusimicrobiota bacterium]HBT61662.1 amino acid permease [Elusimicrobiota bacterium]